MRLVVADTSPLNYLVLTGNIELLPMLFEKVIVPRTVTEELSSQKTPDAVRLWIAPAAPHFFKQDGREVAPAAAGNKWPYAFTYLPNQASVRSQASLAAASA
jgi:hypothetical protein